MENYAVKSIYRDITGRAVVVRVPGSKSITNRALLLAALSGARCTLQNALFSDDSRSFISCLKALGFEVLTDEGARTITVVGHGGKLPNSSVALNVGSAGTAARFITALLGVCGGEFYLDASAQMRRRPMGPLLDALRDMGCSIECEDSQDHFPFRLISGGVKKNEISIDIGSSSQFLSAFLICGVRVREGLMVHVTGSHGMSYINITTKMMEQFGVKVKTPRERLFVVPEGDYYCSQYEIEPDMSAAAYFYGAAAILGISVTVKGVRKNMLQGDVRFIGLLEQMGCQAQDTPDGVCVTGPKSGQLLGVTVDMGSFSDQAITLAAIAPFANSPTTITGISHIRYQESDRIAAIVQNLNSMGIRVDELEGGIRIYPGEPAPALIQTHEDHRLAMGFSLMGLRAPGIIISDPGCCRKTFEDYFKVFEGFSKDACS